MKLHELTTSKFHATKRLGRGIGSGTGKTAGRGTKGQNSRTGGGVKLGFEGGQTKLSMRLPKVRGFKAYKSTQYDIIKLSDLQNMKTTTINAQALVEAKLVSGRLPIKLLVGGSLDKKVTVTVDKASQAAVKQVEKAGGKVVLVGAKPTKSDTIASTKA